MRAADVHHARPVRVQGDFDTAAGQEFHLPLTVEGDGAGPERDLVALAWL